MATKTKKQISLKEMAKVAQYFADDAQAKVYAKRASAAEDEVTDILRKYSPVIIDDKEFYLKHTTGKPSYKKVIDDFLVKHPRMRTAIEILISKHTGTGRDKPGMRKIS